MSARMTMALARGAAIVLIAFVCCSPARAAIRKPPLSPDRIEPLPATEGALQSLGDSLCAIGVSWPRGFLVDYLQPPNDAYFLRVKPATCLTCASAPGVWISAVTMALEFRSACSLPVQVSLVGALGDSACAPPDPRHVIAGPWSSVIGEATPGLYNVHLPLGIRAPVMQTAFLEVEFMADDPACTAAGTRPRLVTTTSCNRCVAWNYYPADTTDLCEVGFPGTPMIWAVVDSCISASYAEVTGGAPREAPLRVWPNPAHERTSIAFSLHTAGHARVSILDVSGRVVRVLADAPFDAGDHVLRWDGRDGAGAALAAGAYFAVVREDERATTRRLVFLR